jgi:predicted acyltransferase
MLLADSGKIAMTTWASPPPPTATQPTDLAKSKQPTVPLRPQAARLISLDVFRGMTIAGMILVNNSGDWQHTYWPLEHAAWNGWTPTDLVFPFFLFIVGVSMTFSFAARAARGCSRANLMLHVLRRAAIIFGLGVGLAAVGIHHLHDLRIPGVLQRIGVVYLFVGLMALTSGRRAWLANAAALLVGYWAIMRFVPVPGIGAGHLDPQNNLAAFTDRALIPLRLYRGTWDPEGILSTLPSIATCLIGLLIGDWMRRELSATRRVAGLIGGGVVLMIVGRALHPVFAINKNIWTSTYVLFTAGCAMLLLGLCYWLIDVKARRGWTMPFLVFGTNAIAVYVLSELMEKAMGIMHVSDAGNSVSLKSYAYHHWFAPLSSNPYISSLSWAIAYVLLWWAIMWVFYRKRVFIKI